MDNITQLRDNLETLQYVFFRQVDTPCANPAEKEKLLQGIVSNITRQADAFLDKGIPDNMFQSASAVTFRTLGRCAEALEGVPTSDFSHANILRDEIREVQATFIPVSRSHLSFNI